MKKLIIPIVFIILICSGYAFYYNSDSFSIEQLYDYQKKYVGEEMPLCSSSPSKTYMDYRSINLPSSKQYKFIQEYMTVDEKTGLLVDSEGFIGVALGTSFGRVGDRFYFTLDSGIVLPLIIIDSKSDSHTINGCQHYIDGSVIEFVIDNDKAAEFFGRYGNGYILQGNFNNYKLFNGEIVKVERVTNEKNENYVTFFKREKEYNNDDIFQYASGY